MTYASILVHLDDTPLTELRVAFASRLAMANDAHLVGLAVVGMFHLPSEVSQALGREYVESRREQLRGDAQKLVAKFEKQVKAAGVVSFEGRLSSGTTEAALTLHGRYSDLVVLARPERPTPDGAMSTDLTAEVLLSLGRPTLLVPASWRDAPVGQRVLVAWSATRESARAVSDAMPILRRAQAVDVVVFNGRNQNGAHGAEPGADIGLLLARHGVKVTVHSDVTSIDVGDSLLSRAADLESDLVVMGAFGHPRLRQIVLGGVSETILRSSPLPVLMSH